MSFTPEQLAILHACDREIDAYCPGKSGRPRSAPDTLRQEKARIRALARYYRLKEERRVRSA